MGRLGRISLWALSSLVAALALAACGSSSSTTTRPQVIKVGGGERKGGAHLSEALDRAAASGVPVRIPHRLIQQPPGGAEETTVLRSPPDSYTLGLSTDPRCDLKGECTAAIFSGFSGGGELTGRGVKLAQGVDGVYEPGRCGPGCKFGTIEWIQDGDRYGVAVAKLPLPELVAYANEAISAPPLGR